MVIDKSVFLRSGGIVEYSQTASAPNTGMVRITVSTPNLGYGPIVARSKEKILCGSEVYTGTLTGKCPDGTYPRRLVNQVIYRKEGGKVITYERPAGYMEFHPTHQHMHTNDWEHMSLRVKTEGIADPRKWPVVGTVAKTGFCLQDWRSCSQLPGSCQSKDEKVLTDAEIPNFGLGGGQFDCDPYEQGISVGYVDVYPYDYDGMGIRIPPDTCNGSYHVVIEVDPLRQYAELDTTNNVHTVPVFLTEQRSGFHKYAKLNFSRPPRQLCEGDDITLTANPAFSYLWSNGATTPTITVRESGTYFVAMKAPCGTDQTSPIQLSFTPQKTTPTLNATSKICKGQRTTLSSNEAGVWWYNVASGGTPIGKGQIFKTPPLVNNTTFWASIPSFTSAEPYRIGLTDPRALTGNYHEKTDGYLIFNVFQPIRLKTVKVLANERGLRTIELRSGNGQVLRDTTLLLSVGENRVLLNFNIAPGQGYQLGLSDHSLGGLYRNQDDGIEWPIEIPNMVSITGASAGFLYYYYFYDWELEEQTIACTNKRVPIEVTVETCYSDLEKVTIAPNPTDAILRLFVPYVMENLKYKILNASGKQVGGGELESLNVDSHTTISVKELPSGVYLLLLENSDGETSIKKFIKVRT